MIQWIKAKIISYFIFKYNISEISQRLIKGDRAGDIAFSLLQRNSNTYYDSSEDEIFENHMCVWESDKLKLHNKCSRILYYKIDELDDLLIFSKAKSNILIQ